MSLDRNQYPHGAQAVDEFISREISGLRGTVEVGFERIDRRLESVVTKDAFQAEVNRLDQRDDHLESTMESGFSAMEAKMLAGFEAISARDAARDLAAEKRDEVRDARFARRMTWTISIAAVLWSVTQFFILQVFSG